MARRRDASAGDGDWDIDMSNTFNIELDEGVPYQFSIAYQDDSGVAIPFAGGTTARMQVRDTADPTSPVLFTLTSSDGLVINNALGTVAGTISTARGILLPIVGRGALKVHDLFVYPTGGDEIKMFGGTIGKAPRVTTP